MRHDEGAAVLSSILGRGSRQPGGQRAALQRDVRMLGLLMSCLDHMQDATSGGGGAEAAADGGDSDARRSALRGLLCEAVECGYAAESATYALSLLGRSEVVVAEWLRVHAKGREMCLLLPSPKCMFRGYHSSYRGVSEKRELQGHWNLSAGREHTPDHWDR